MVWFNGGFVDDASAMVSIFDRGYQLGEGVFATLHAYRGRCFRADRHLAQLAAGAELLGLAVPTALPLDEVAARVEAPEARVRVTVTNTATSIVAESLVPPTPAQYMHGIAAVVVEERRAPSAIKSTSYASSLVARRQARGADEAIQLAFDGSVACGAMANVFAVFGDELATPSLDSGCRPGVTRTEIVQLADSVGLRPVERRVAPAELFAADEAFFTNTRIECLPIASVDGRALRLGSYASALRGLLRKRAGA